jgi:hypothetical protein
VDVLSAVAPGVLPVPGWRFSRWYKFTFKERERPFRLQQLGGYLCHAYGERTGAPLASLTLVENLPPPLAPGGAAGPLRRRVLWSGSCAPPGVAAQDAQQ